MCVCVFVCVCLCVCVCVCIIKYNSMHETVYSVEFLKVHT